eukprot:CAMPEP_0202820310 /NCGR_PEP_ID=MMETSP1389-20130828/9646_1 /ASSEMBLY_ACC=CAM_ASM_000865 /TAXON_ID=302021 /ORGANISM="Rhodomonas sp., Strain CCMP768" /LENGTH=57 /DNA_ID=CAMNT_0049492971 /DNA_START=50 /DNA_END=219 /DNA_ORIENTATION=+
MASRDRVRCGRKVVGDAIDNDAPRQRGGEAGGPERHAQPTLCNVLAKGRKCRQHRRV